MIETAVLNRDRLLGDKIVSYSYYTGVRPFKRLYGKSTFNETGFSEKCAVRDFVLFQHKEMCFFIRHFFFVYLKNYSFEIKIMMRREEKQRSIFYTLLDFFLIQTVKKNIFSWLMGKVNNIFGLYICKTSNKTKSSVHVSNSPPA